MNNQQKRTALKNAYPGKKWSDKVDKMDDQTVVAIYLRLKGQGKV